MWADADRKGTSARLDDLLAASDFVGLARWVDEISEAGDAYPHDPNPFETQLEWIDKAVAKMLGPQARSGTASSAPALLALYRAAERAGAADDQEARILAAAKHPSFAQAAELQALAAEIRATRAAELAAREADHVRAVAAATPLPATVDDLVALLSDVERGDPLGVARFDVTLGTGYSAVGELVVALVASGRSVSAALLDRMLPELSYPSLRDADARAAFAKLGPRAEQLCGIAVEKQRKAELADAEHARYIARLKAENDALYGVNRRRPCTPGEVVELVKKGDLEGAIAAYAGRLPGAAEHAAQAVEDARAFFAPEVPAASTT